MRGDIEVALRHLFRDFIQFFQRRRHVAREVVRGSGERDHRQQHDDDRVKRDLPRDARIRRPRNRQRENRSVLQPAEFHHVRRDECSAVTVADAADGDHFAWCQRLIGVRHLTPFRNQKWNVSL